MARKDDRVIHQGIRVSNTVGGKGRVQSKVITDPDELVESGVDLQPLYDAGAISGTWKGVKQAEETATTEASETKTATRSVTKTTTKGKAGKAE